MRGVWQGCSITQDILASISHACTLLRDMDAPNKPSFLIKTHGTYHSEPARRDETAATKLQLELSVLTVTALLLSNTMTSFLSLRGIETYPYSHSPYDISSYQSGHTTEVGQMPHLCSSWLHTCYWRAWHLSTSLPAGTTPLQLPQGHPQFLRLGGHTQHHHACCQWSPPALLPCPW